MAGHNFSLTEQVTEKASLAIIEEVASRGLADIACRDYTTIAGPGDEQRLLERLNKRSVRNRPRIRKAMQPA